MSEKQPFEPTEESFETICRAVMETERGRWFLTEFARQNRAADTKEILNKLDEMRKVFNPNRTSSEPVESEQTTVIRSQLHEIASSIQEARQEILAIKPRKGNDEHLSAATEELDAIVDSTEKATTDILESAEALQDHAENLRNLGIDPEICNDIEAHATAIFMACSFQDITGQRTTKVMHAIRTLDQRVQNMLQMWESNGGDKSLPIAAADDPRPDAYLLNGPQLAGAGKSQDEIDELLTAQIDELESHDRYEQNLETLKEVADDVVNGTEVDVASATAQAPTTPATAIGGATNDAETEEEIAQDDIDALFDNEVA